MSKSKRRFGEEEDQRTLFRGHRVRHFSKSVAVAKQELNAPSQPPPREFTRKSS